MQDNFIQKLNQRASKNLSFLEVKVNDNNYEKMSPKFDKNIFI